LWQRHRTLAERLVTDDWERETLYRAWADLLKSFDRIVRAIATLANIRHAAATLWLQSANASSGYCWPWRCGAAGLQHS
jgi:hypothetical protein